MGMPATAPRAASRRQPSLLYVVKQVEQAIRSQLDDLLRPVGVSTAQYTALTVLSQREAISSAELARLSFVTAQSMSDVVAGLETRGLIRRDRDPANRRRLLISITPAGEALMAMQAAAVGTLERLMVSRLDGARVDALRAALNDCRAALAEPTRRGEGGR